MAMQNVKCVVVGDGAGKQRARALADSFFCFSLSPQVIFVLAGCPSVVCPPMIRGLTWMEAGLGHV